MGALLTWLAGAFASLVGYSAVRFTAWKLVIYTLTVTILPIVLTNLIYTIIEIALTLADDVQGSYGLSSVVVQFTGISAWFATHLMIPEGISILLSALTARLALKMIPFVRL